MDNGLTFGQWLKRRRRGLGLTQRALGELIGYSSETVRKVEADELRPSRQLAERLAHALEVEPAERDRFVRFARDEAEPDDAHPLPTQTVQLPAHPSASPELPRHNLPAPLTNFIGRAKEIAEVRQLLGARRLVTLTGAGGMGKSRLSIEAASGLLAAYPHGVWLVELAALTDPLRVPQVVARVFGVSESAGQPVLEALAAYLRQRTLLLLLDNCEHLIDACASLAVALLQAAPGLRLLANSREGLAIEGEVVYDLPSLSVPQTAGHALPLAQLHGYEAVRLFVDRAALALPSFALTPANASAVTQVCQRLEGMPLAIELAAARVKLLQVEQIAARLDDRFRLLARDSRSAAPRHQTLQATIDWSYELLPEAERAVLRRAAVFAGGWTLEAAEAVCLGQDVEAQAVLDLLTSLARKSMVVVERAAGGPARYRLLETIREYAMLRLCEAGEQPGTLALHAQFFLEFAEEAEQYVHHAQQAVWLERLRVEFNNIRAALEWCLEDGYSAEVGARLVSCLWCFWILHGYWAEGLRWQEKALAAFDPEISVDAPEAAIVRGRLCARAGLVNMAAGRIPRSEELSSEGLPLCRTFGTPNDLAEATFVKAYTTWNADDPAQAKTLFEAAVELSRAAGDRWYEAASLSQLSGIAFDDGQLEQAEQRWLVSAEIFRELQDVVGYADNLGALAMIARWQGRYADAKALREEQIQHYRSMGVRRNIALSLHDRADLAYAVGDYAEARRFLDEALALFREQGFALAIPSVIRDFGNIARREGDYLQAETLLAQSLELEQGSTNRDPYSVLSLGALARCQRQHTRALEHIREALRAFHALPSSTWGKLGIAASLWELGMLLADGPHAERAVRLFGAAAAIRATLSNVLSPVAQAETDMALAGLGQTLGNQAFAAAWANGNRMTLEQAAALALEDSALFQDAIRLTQPAALS